MNMLYRIGFLSVAFCGLLAAMINSAQAQVSVVQAYGPAPVYAYPAPVTTYYAPGPAYYAPAPVTSYYAPAAGYYAPPPVVSYYAPAPVYAAPVYAVPARVVYRANYVPLEPVRNIIRARRW